MALNDTKNDVMCKQTRAKSASTLSSSTTTKCTCALAEGYALSYQAQSLLKDGLILKIRFTNVYGCPLGPIVFLEKSRTLSWAYYSDPSPRMNQRKNNNATLAQLCQNQALSLMVYRKVRY